MANAYKILGQSAPSSTATTGQSVLTVATSHSAVVSTLVVANTTTSAATYRVHACIAGAANAASNALVYDATVLGSSSVTLTLGITLAASDVLGVASGTANALTFTAFGSDIT